MSIKMNFNPDDFFSSENVNRTAIKNINSIIQELGTPQEYEKSNVFYNEETGKVDITGISDELAIKVRAELDRRENQ